MKHYVKAKVQPNGNIEHIAVSTAPIPDNALPEVIPDAGIPVPTRIRAAVFDSVDGSFIRGREAIEVLTFANDRAPISRVSNDVRSEKIVNLREGEE